MQQFTIPFPQSMCDMDTKTAHRRVEMIACGHIQAKFEILTLWGNFLRILTGDETWIHHYEPESKWRAWNGNILSRQNSIISWKRDSHDFLGLSKINTGQGVNTVWYIEMVRNKRGGLLSRDITMHVLIPLPNCGQSSFCGVGASSAQPRSCPTELLFVWSPQRCWSVLRIVPILPHRTIICLVTSKEPYEDEYSSQMKRLS